MKVSIITPSYNSAATIRGTLTSVADQSYTDIEHLVIDGASTDETANIVEPFEATFLSEPDGGIYDAMNKGVRKAQGEVIGILNSDDFFVGPHVISSVVRVFEETQADMVYADIAIVDATDISKIRRYWRSGQFRRWKLPFGWIFPHPAVFVRSTMYDRLGTFDEQFRISADYDFLLRAAKDVHTAIAYLPIATTYMRDGGYSNASLTQRNKGWQQLKAIWKKNGGHFSTGLILFRLLHKLPQYFLPGLQFKWFNRSL